MTKAGNQLLSLCHTKIEGTDWGKHFHEYNQVDWLRHNRKIKNIFEPTNFTDVKAGYVKAIDHLPEDRVFMMAYGIHLHEINPNCENYKAIKKKLSGTQWTRLIDLLELADTFELKKNIHKWFVTTQVAWSTEEEKCIAKQS